MPMDRRRFLSVLWKLVLCLIPTIFLVRAALGSTNSYLGGRDGYRDLIPGAGVPQTGPNPSIAAKAVFRVQGEKEDFLGKRPDVRTAVNASNIIEACKGTGSDGWRDTRNCVDHLRLHQDEYHVVTTSAQAACDPKNPVKYHTYWRGPPTSRVSFMLKSYFYTQNLECSQMHIWLDCDHNPDAIKQASESIFMQPFAPLIESGLIVLRSWTYPSSVYIPREYQIDDFGPDNMLEFKAHQIPRGPVAVSDSVRFIVLHQEGGFYIDMDTMFLRDVRPLLIAQNLSFAERWAAHPRPGEYNTAYLRLSPFSALSSLVLQGASKMGLNFHPRVVGRMLAKTGRGDDLLMFETALFDPLWSEFDRERTGICCTPCLTDFAEFYDPEPIPGEWVTLRQEDVIPATTKPGNAEVEGHALNRTLSTFYVGAYTHHIHNQWRSRVIPGSWIWVADQTFGQFLQGKRVNPYGERWRLGPMEFPADEALYQA